MEVALEQAYRSVLENRIHAAAGEYAGQQSSDRSTCAMHSESIERIVISKVRLYLGNHEVAEHARNQTDQQCRHRADESRCGSDRQLRSGQ
jgi:hypothetical protein